MGGMSSAGAGRRGGGGGSGVAVFSGQPPAGQQPVDVADLGRDLELEASEGDVGDLRQPFGRRGGSARRRMEK